MVMQHQPRAVVATFVAALQGYVEREDRAALAALRRGVGKAPGMVPEMHPYVLPHLPANAIWLEDAAYLVAALFGTYPSDRVARDLPDLGASFARLGSLTDSGGVERRFVALLAADADQLPSHLQHAISLLRAHDVGVDWVRLMEDVLNWDWPSRTVQRHWARSFWGRAQSSESAEPVGGEGEGEGKGKAAAS